MLIFRWKKTKKTLRKKAEKRPRDSIATRKKKLKVEKNGIKKGNDPDFNPEKNANKKKSENSTDSENKKPVKKRKRTTEVKVKEEDKDADDDDNDNGNKKRKRKNMKLDSIKIEKFVNLNEFKEPVTCKDCEAKFETHIELGMHSVTHSKEDLYSCHMCDYSNDKKSLFKNHIRGHDLWQCERCNKIFKSKRCALKHSKTHVVKSFVQCDICGKDVRNVYLETHKKLVHADEKSVQIYKCHLCDKAYKNSTALKGHYSFNHKEYGVDTSVICDICGLRLSCKGKLAQHLRTHTGDRPFPCTVCPRKFISKDILRAHMRVHTGEKPYICMYCGKKFAHGAPYRYHIKTHTGEKSFICTVCGKGFISRANMRIHMKSCMFPVKLFNEYPVINK